MVYVYWLKNKLAYSDLKKASLNCSNDFFNNCDKN